MHGEDLLIDDSRNGEAVEAIREGLPQLNVVPPLALIVETIDTVDGRTLVVTTENEEVLGVFDLVSQKEADGLKRLLATVDVVTQEQVVGLGREATVFEKTQKIVVLAVDITADLIISATGLVSAKDRRDDPISTGTNEGWRFYLDGCLQFQQYGLGDEDFPSLGAKITNLRLQKLNLLARPAAPHLQQSINDRVQIHVLIGHV